MLIRKYAPDGSRPVPDGRGDRQRAIAAETEALRSLGLSTALLARVLPAAYSNGTSLEEELLAAGLLRPETYYRDFAAALDLPFLTTQELRLYLPALRSGGRPLDTQLSDPRWLLLGPSSEDGLVVVPKALELRAWQARLDRQQGLRGRLFVTTPKALRQTVWAGRATERQQRAANNLAEERPQFSARRVVTRRQIVVSLLGMSCLFAWLGYCPGAFDALHLATTLHYLATIGLRGAAALLRPRSFSPTRQALAPLLPLRPLQARDEALPFYTVLVALHREEAVAAQLIDALSALDWPASRLDIKLICEADDRATVAALLACRPGPQFELVVVPPGLPRTKPKALNYGLAGAKGEFLTVYDAEDRPMPGQLREAYRRFRANEALACLQAPLIITNGPETWLTAGFALEYSMLFRLLLPTLGHHGMPMPLGGTSNHFRRATLEAVGAWDAYNMTEDADLGLRLHRLGHKIDVIATPTLEDAPTDIPVWLAQRARWFKGWMQTWLVLMRHPVRLLRDVGMVNCLVLHFLIAGMVVSALLHPFTLILLLRTLIHFGLGQMPQTIFDWCMLGLDGSAIALGYGLPYLFGRMCMSQDERKRVGFAWAWLPLYWFLMSFAAWRAGFELCRRPFVWNKTPHNPTQMPESQDKDEPRVKRRRSLVRWRVWSG